MTRVSLALAAIVLATACEQQATPRSSNATAPAAPALTAEQPSSVRWPQAARINSAARSALSQDALSVLQESPVPVLLPGEPELLRSGRAGVTSDRYTFSAQQDTMTVYLQASQAPAPQPSGPISGLEVRRTPAAGRDVLFTEAEGMRMATWVENGVSYLAEVECASAADARCRDDAYLLTVIEKLVFVGGKGAPVR